MADPFMIVAGADARGADRLAIADTAILYATAVDLLGNSPVAPGSPDPGLERATALMARALTPDARLSLLLAGPGGPAQPLGEGGPRAVVEAIRTYFTAYGYVGTHHPVANVRVAFMGTDTADATSTIPCHHWLSDGRMLLTPVRYEDRMVRQDDGWRIAERTVLAMRFWVAEGYAADPLDPALPRIA